MINNAIKKKKVIITEALIAEGINKLIKTNDADSIKIPNNIPKNFRPKVSLYLFSLM